MFCSGCGTEAADDATYCSKCGNALAAAPVGAGSPSVGQESSNVLGIVSIVLAAGGFVVSLVFFGLGLLASIAAIVVGVIGLRRVKQGRASSRALPWVGIGLGVVLPLLAVLFVSVFLLSESLPRG